MPVGSNFITSMPRKGRNKYQRDKTSGWTAPTVHPKVGRRSLLLSFKSRQDPMTKHPKYPRQFHRWTSRSDFVGPKRKNSDATGEDTAPNRTTLPAGVTSNARSTNPTVDTIPRLARLETPHAIPRIAPQIFLDISKGNRLMIANYVLSMVVSPPRLDEDQHLGVKCA